MIRIPLVVLAMVAGVLVGACRSSPTASFYTLSPDATLAPMTPAGSVHVVVAPVTVPDALNRPQIVTRVGANQIRFDEFARWGEPLKADVARTIAGNLARLLGSDHVSVFDTGVDALHTWRVRVDIMRFDATAGDAVTIEAQWTVTPPGKLAPAGGALVGGTSLARQQMDGTGYDALVSASNRALGAVSSEIAAVIMSGSPR